MPRPSQLNQLAPDDLTAFERELVNRNFSDYDGLVEWLAARGYEISRSVAHRHGQKVKRRLEAVKASTEAARLIAEAAPDDADLRSAAVISMVQSEMFELLLNLQEAEECDDPAGRVALMAKAAKGMADLTRASVGQKKWQMEVEAKIRAEERAKAAEKAVSIARKGGMSTETTEALRREILGIAT